MKNTYKLAACVVLFGLGSVMAWQDRSQYGDRGTSQTQIRDQGSSQTGGLDIHRIDQLTKAKGEFRRNESVYVVTVAPAPEITVGEKRIPAPMMIQNHAFFKRSGGQTIVFAVLALRENQVNPVIDVALRNGLKVNSLHGQLMWESPKIMYMRLSGVGDTDQLAGAIGQIHDTILGRMGADTGTSGGCPTEKAECGTVQYRHETGETCVEEKSETSCPETCQNGSTKQESSCEQLHEGTVCNTFEVTCEPESKMHRDGATEIGGINIENTTLDPRTIENVLGVGAERRQGLYLFSLPRSTTIEGRRIGKEMAVKDWAVFAGSNDNAVMRGFLAVPESELQGTIRVLRQYKINITGIVNHLTMEQPRIIFIHFIGTGTTRDLANGFKAAVEAGRGMPGADSGTSGKSTKSEHGSMEQDLRKHLDVER